MVLFNGWTFHSPFGLVSDGLRVEDVALDSLKGQIGWHEGPFSKAFDSLSFGELNEERKKEKQSQRNSIFKTLSI